MIRYNGKDLPVSALVLAGGSGTRMSGGDLPKQYLMLGGQPVILYSVRQFLSCSSVDSVIIVCPEVYISYTRDLVRRFAGEDRRVCVTAGGADRNASLMNGMRKAWACADGAEDAIVLTHDAARPFLTGRIIEENIEAAASYGACSTAIPATDTILRSDDGELVSEIPKRSRMYQVQTPQSFRYSLLMNAMTARTSEELSAFTDACGILQADGVPVKLVSGENYNIKLTYPQDMYTGEGILKEYFDKQDQ